MCYVNARMVCLSIMTAFMVSVLLLGCPGFDPDECEPESYFWGDTVGTVNQPITFAESICEIRGLIQDCTISKTIDYGDGTIEQLSLGAIPNHTYTTAGIYTVTQTCTMHPSGIYAFDTLSVTISDIIPDYIVPPDTGQDICYDAFQTLATCPAPGNPFFGQDANYTTLSMSFSDNLDGTVTDNVTGLMWQQADDNATYNWFEASGTTDTTYNPGGAVNVCGSLNVGMYNDWRLPTRLELVTILHLGQVSPAIDAVFTDTESDYYWTADTAAFNSDNAWTVRFQDGFIWSYAKSGATVSGYVRCVREGPVPIVNRYADNGNGTVTDIGSGLVWQQNDSGAKLNWEDALTYCEALVIDNISDWKLPDAKELESIVDLTRNNPSIDPLFLNTQSENYWSSTPAAGVVENQSWETSFDTGNVVQSLGRIDPTLNYVRCVR